jgi:hypothetical protein
MKLSKKLILLSLLALTLTGCGSMTGQLTNRVGITLAGDELLFHSFYGPFAVTVKVDPKDRDALVNASKK